MIVPRDVIRCRVHPSVTIIPADAFLNLTKLEDVELYEGLLEVGECAFEGCISLKVINIPNTVTVIRKSAFRCCTKLRRLSCLQEW